MDLPVEHERQISGCTCATASWCMAHDYLFGSILSRPDQYTLYRELRSRYIEGVPLSNLALYAAKIGHYQIELFHSETVLFRDSFGLFEKNLFDNLVREYRMALDEAALLGVRVKAGVWINAQYLKNLLAGGNLVLLVGQVRGELHVVLLSGFDECGFWVQDPLTTKEFWNDEKLHDFSRTGVGSWGMAVKPIRV